MYIYFHVPALISSLNNDKSPVTADLGGAEYVVRHSISAALRAGHGGGLSGQMVDSPLLCCLLLADACHCSHQAIWGELMGEGNVL
ncbi:hypothetical protein AcW1_009378 [Taiwanofungus camphoratus]|nr:hypothetical protein AcW1_009378 [Antrodia cinnamomea]